MASVVCVEIKTDGHDVANNPETYSLKGEHMRTKRIALVGASLVLMGGMTAACGGSPEDASEKDFCAAYEKVDEVDDFEGLKAAVEDLEDVGTPKGISEDGRKGFEIAVDAIGDLENEEDELDEDSYSDKDKERLEAFTTYAAETCS